MANIGHLRNPVHGFKELLLGNAEVPALYLTHKFFQIPPAVRLQAGHTVHRIRQPRRADVLFQ